MARSGHIGTGFVHRAVNQEASGIGWPAHVAADGITVVVNEDHIAGFEEAEVSSIISLAFSHIV